MTIDYEKVEISETARLLAMEVHYKHILELLEIVEQYDWGPQERVTITITMRDKLAAPTTKMKDVIETALWPKKKKDAHNPLCDLDPKTLKVKAVSPFRRLELTICGECYQRMLVRDGEK